MLHTHFLLPRFVAVAVDFLAGFYRHQHKVTVAVVMGFVHYLAHINSVCYDWMMVMLPFLDTDTDSASDKIVLSIICVCMCVHVCVCVSMSIHTVNKYKMQAMKLHHLLRVLCSMLCAIICHFNIQYEHAYLFEYYSNMR